MLLYRWTTDIRVSFLDVVKICMTVLVPALRACRGLRKDGNDMFVFRDFQSALLPSSCQGVDPAIECFYVR